MTKFVDAFGNDCEWYAQNPQYCKMAGMTKTQDGKSAKECEACKDEEVEDIPDFWVFDNQTLVAEKEIEEPCQVGACAMDSDCGCIGSRCEMGVCMCSEGCESVGNICVPEVTENFTQEQENPPPIGWILGVLLLILILVLIGGSMVGGGRGGGRRMCFG